MFCTRCGHEIAEGQRFCDRCGAPVAGAGAAPRCPTCGAQVPAGTTFCINCGARLVAPQAAVAEPAPAPPKRRRRGLWVLVVIGALLVFACGINFFVQTLRDRATQPTPSLQRTLPAKRIPTLDDRGQPTARPTPGPRTPVELSQEQQRLLARLSTPDTFTLIMAEDEEKGSGQFVRIELWNYHTLGTCFKFVNGEFRGVDEAKELTEPTDFPAFTPEQFSRDLTIEDLNALVDDIPQAGADVVPEIMEGAEIYVYEQGLLVAFAEGQLAYVTTESVLPTGSN